MLKIVRAYSSIPTRLYRKTIKPHTVIDFAERFKDAEPSEKEEAKRILTDCWEILEELGVTNPDIWFSYIDYLKPLATATRLLGLSRNPESYFLILHVIMEGGQERHYRFAGEIMEEAGHLAQAMYYYIYAGDLDAYARAGQKLA